MVHILNIYCLFYVVLLSGLVEINALIDVLGFDL